MAIQPIDAQILFSRLNQMGKEQAEQRDNQVNAQVLMGQQIAKRSEEAGRKVVETEKTEQGDVRQLKDEERRRRGQEKKSSADGEPEKEQKDEELRDAPVRETHLGKKIDIKG